MGLVEDLPAGLAADLVVELSSINKSGLIRVSVVQLHKCY